MIRRRGAASFPFPFLSPGGQPEVSRRRPPRHPAPHLFERVELHVPRLAHRHRVNGGAQHELLVAQERLAVVAHEAEARDARHCCG